MMNKIMMIKIMNKIMMIKIMMIKIMNKMMNNLMMMKWVIQKKGKIKDINLKITLQKSLNSLILFNLNNLLNIQNSLLFRIMKMNNIYKIKQ